MDLHSWTLSIDPWCAVSPSSNALPLHALIQHPMIHLDKIPGKRQKSINQMGKHNRKGGKVLIFSSDWLED